MKTIDCFPYNGDAIALFRLAYLWDVVDEFIIVEARETHTGLRKEELFLDRNADQFQPYAGKVTRLVIDKFPQPSEAELTAAAGPKGKVDPAAWFREKYQRNFPREFLLSRDEGARWILLGCDADEIPRRELVASFAQSYDSLNIGYRLQMPVFYYSSRWIKPSAWFHAFVANDVAVRQRSLDDLRIGPSIKKALPKAGWHLSYFMTSVDIQRKVQAFAHTELNSKEARDLEWIQHCRRTGEELYNTGVKENCLPYDGDDLPEGLRAFEDLHGIRV